MTKQVDFFCESPNKETRFRHRSIMFNDLEQIKEEIHNQGNV